MQDLLENSLKRFNQNQSPVKLTNLSPEKYGKGAFCDLAYTPSKLVDNILYRQVTTLKKVQEGNGKLRQSEALNSLLQDRLQQLKEQRDGIERSLNSQIAMYKKLLQQCENRSEARMKQIQNNFKLQLKKIISEKQQQAKYSQSERQLLQNRIAQLEAIIEELESRFTNQVKLHNELKNQKQKVDILHRHSMNDIKNLQSQRQIDDNKNRNKFDELHKQMISNTSHHGKQLQNTIANKNKQIQNLQKFHQTQLQKIQNKRIGETFMKNQQLKDITNVFEAQTKRLNQIISMKERMVDGLTKDLNKQKQKVLQLTRTYQNQIGNLAHEKVRLIEQLDEINNHKAVMNIKLDQNKAIHDKQRVQMQHCIKQLKDNIEYNQVNYIREKDRNMFIAGDLENQIILLRNQNNSLRISNNEVQALNCQVRSLRELLLESSNQMKRCREEFIRMGKQRDILILKLRELGCENDVLHRVKCEREEEARGWKESYYNTRSRY